MRVGAANGFEEKTAIVQLDDWHAVNKRRGTSHEMIAFSPSVYLRRRSKPREGRMASLHVAQARVTVIIVRMDVKMPNVTFMVFSGERCAGSGLVT